MPQSQTNKLTISTSFADVLKTMGEDTPETNISKWTRPSPRPIDVERDSIVFQHIDIQEGKGRRPTIQLFGITQDGHTLLAHVQDFRHYFYFPSPEGITDDDLKPIKDALNDILKAENGIPIVDDIQRTREHPRQDERKKEFLKIFVPNPQKMKAVRDESNLAVNRHGYLFPTHVFGKGELHYKDYFCSPQKTYESKTSYTRRFMMDTKINSMTWVKAPAGSYMLISELQKQSHCQLEISVKFDDLEVYEFEGDPHKIAPMRILSLDIECSVRPLCPDNPHPKNNEMSFPNHRNLEDDVIQIANMVTQYGDNESFVRNIFTLKSCAPIAGAETFSFDSESELLNSWQKFIMDVDPDLIIGYNIGRFDLPYLLNRGKLRCIAGFGELGRMKGISVKIDDIQGQRDWINTPWIPGRIFLDMLYFVRKEHPELKGPGATTLDAVSNHFLGYTKEDVSVHMMSRLQNGDENSRRDLAIYCLKDAYLPQQLMDKLDGLKRWIKISRELRVGFNELLYLDDPTKKSLKERNMQSIYPDN